MNMTASLAPEWQRLDILSHCLHTSRRGEALDEKLKTRLATVQQQVQQLRELSPWRDVAAQHHLNALDQDILACVLAPEVEPHLGWIFQELQPGIATYYPTPALIHELFFMSATHSGSLRQRLGRNAPLSRAGLLQHHQGENFQPLRATAYAHKLLLGWSDEHPSLPGAIRIALQASWQELVLPDHCLRAMQEFMLWVRCREQVGERWGARLGGGPVALFSGPSGTGKTLAAEIMATELGLSLYRVDLGLLVSKYIGETEKNLNALFDAAEQQPVMLLFDEADSLFGKRGNVKDARDRYANMEVSHLLSRLERYHGPCILTTNLRQHLDPAFSRRFQSIIEFPPPDTLSRQTLWQKLLPPRAPLAADVDLELISQAVSLTGGQIRNAALHAAFLAAGESMPITLGHITSAIWTELAKEGQELLLSNMGALAPYLEQAVA